MDKRYLTEKEVSDLTGFALSTLRNDRHTHKGMPYIKKGRAVRYHMGDVINYMEARKVQTYDSEVQK
ncbi:MAG: helix-turn-helix domain-containing protein [Desulfobacterales bacterium]|nr:helix-turn-helix domain-containing protein [Desulfobacterales bacterium]